MADITEVSIVWNDESTDPCVGVFTDQDEAEKVAELFTQAGYSSVYVVGQREIVDVMSADQWADVLAREIEEESAAT